MDEFRVIYGCGVRPITVCDRNRYNNTRLVCSFLLGDVEAFMSSLELEFESG
ncbi:hypothetical protein SISNIDRAFT_454576 [Sistotremastrum niveocremeum HHB9708]|uniref:Uncharacterized protein n=1 Tax=Sistotremastrum niveocremeum HHB9708 TaxID=1314777 RepID=A0A164UNM8_9AGAM|nr:hypothetical protein SISNIDRAFT_454576 [Sistotremastrum niveocremeum HHB9708]